MALNSLFCTDVPLSNYSLTHVVLETKGRKTKSWSWSGQRTLKMCCYRSRLDFNCCFI